VQRAAALIALALASAAAMPAPARADDPGLAAGLVRSAWYWQARGREDKAEEAWGRVLAADPNDAEALAATGGFAARAGRAQQARDALAKLEKVSPRHPATRALRRQIELGPRLGALVADARKLVHDGRLDEGAARYRELFRASGPPGDLALEYYQTIEGAEGGWQEARDGLRQLVQRAPDEARYRLELAKVLTYREETRREGVRALESLSRDASVAKEANAAWRQAVLWLSPSGGDAALAEAYLRAHPRDAEVARHLDRMRSAATVKEGFAALDRGDAAEAERLFREAGDDPGAKRGLAVISERQASAARKSGFAALEKGDLRGAERLFRGAGDDANSRLGLALVAQREGLEALRRRDLGRARDLLERARQLAPDRPDVWEAPLRSAEFWSLLDEARDARARGADREAEARLLDALERGPVADRWHAEVALGDLYAARGDRDRAEQRYRQALSAAPDDPSALRGLASLLVQGGRFDEALPVNERLARAAPAQAFRPEWLGAEAHRRRAAQAKEAGDADRAPSSWRRGAPIPGTRGCSTISRTSCSRRGRSPTRDRSWRRCSARRRRCPRRASCRRGSSPRRARTPRRSRCSRRCRPRATPGSRRSGAGSR
jgi:tetratricopeptide (TPR) repeat protein